MIVFSVPGLYDQAAEGWAYPLDQARNMLRVQPVTLKVNGCIGAPHRGDRLGGAETFAHSDYWTPLFKLVVLSSRSAGHGYCCSHKSILKESTVLWELKTCLAWSTLGNVQQRLISIENNEQKRPVLKRDFSSREAVLIFSGHTVRYRSSTCWRRDKPLQLRWLMHYSGRQDQPRTWIHFLTVIQCNMKHF